MDNLLGIGVLLAFYFLPTIVVLARGAEHPGPAIVVNAFLGWTVLGWIIALAMSFGGATRRVHA